MKHCLSRHAASLAFAVAAALPLAAFAHRPWMLPSSTVLSGNEPWVTVDAAISDDVFYFDNNPVKLDTLAITAPDGSTIAPENQNTSRFRSSFDLKLVQKGTYKMAVTSESVFASFKQAGETKRIRAASMDALAREVPADASELQATQMQTRVETFVTSGKPNTTALKPGGKALEMEAVTHPNDMVVGEPAQFRFLLDGRPAADLEVAVVPGGVRYRDRLRDVRVKTDADGRISIRWSEPGMYWISATHATEPQGPARPGRRATYAATIEVLP